VTLRDAWRLWLLVGLNSFGGPAGQISVMHREVVERRRLISERRFLHALNYCLLLPGPEAQQLSTYLGWLFNGVRGGVVAGLLFILPGFVVMMALAAGYATFGDVPVVDSVIRGLQAGVVALVASAVVGLSRRAVTTRGQRALAVAAFVALYAFAVPFPVVVLGAALLGWLTGQQRVLAAKDDSLAGTPIRQTNPTGPGPTALDSPATEDAGDRYLLPDEGTLDSAATRGARRAAVVCLVLWLLPVALVLLTTGTSSVYSQQAVLFSTAAVVTFGGAYAVLTYISQQAVSTYGWISEKDMAVGLGLAETTPGPLIMVVQFVGFLAAYANPGSLPPLVAGVLGGTLAVWVTFAPCFMFIFAGAPYVERLRSSVGLGAALRAVGAAVVGVIANLGVWFAVTALFQESQVADVGPASFVVPVPGSVDPLAVVIAALALLGLLVWRRSTWQVVLGSAALGLALGVLGSS
jgi:chromate transporter